MMTKDEQAVIDVLEHHAQQWDAADPQQAQSFRDAASVLTRLANGVVWLTTSHPNAPEETPAPAPLTDETAIPEGTSTAPVSTDPADAPPPSGVIPSTDPDAETPANG